jgi:uncharacterized protein YkwD
VRRATWRLALAALVVVAVSWPQATTVSDALSPGAIENCFASSINYERRHAGVKELPRLASQDSAARTHSSAMARKSTIFHSTPDGTWGGENVGMGPDCPSIHNAFMASAGHKSNILDKDWAGMGVGVVVRDDTVYVTERFTYPRSNSAPRPTPSPKLRRKDSCSRT